MEPPRTLGDVDVAMGSADDPLIQDLLKQIVTLAEEASTVVGELMKELDLTEVLATALWRLDPEEAPPSMRALAATLNCDPSTITFITDRLQQRGLIQRMVSPADRRFKVIALTPQGVQVRTRFVQALAAGTSLTRLPADEQQQLRALLAKAGADPARFTCRASAPQQSPQA